MAAPLTRKRVDKLTQLGPKAFMGGDMGGELLQLHRASILEGGIGALGVIVVHGIFPHLNAVVNALGALQGDGAALFTCKFSHIYFGHFGLDIM